ncbi:MAG: hypothetical protein K8J08_06090, partial [Thermoanaerobaculia bacterium]|nr:hypothetical protein [Thermoanaerobaculia bacterium]
MRNPFPLQILRPFGLPSTFIRRPLRLAISLTTILLLPQPSVAATITVGPGCQQTTVQGAIDAAEATSGSDEIRLSRLVTFTEDVIVGQTSSDLITVSGGWNGCSA